MVYLRKQCPEHGDFQVPAWKEGEGAPEFLTWKNSPRIPARPREPATPLKNGCPYDCGLCPEHAQHTCTGLIEVTMRCSLGCPICYARSSGAAFEVTSPLPGTITKIIAPEGTTVAAGDTILIIEAMKMETEIKTEKGGRVSKILVNVKDVVTADQAVALVEE